MEIFFQILKNWWWIFFPPISYFLSKFFYFWWMQWEVFHQKRSDWILLELIPPKEVKKPFSAMENVFSMFFMNLYDSPLWRERWCRGAWLLAYGGWASLEICSFGGEIHFYLRILRGAKSAFETAIYSQYPEIEIKEVEDYTQRVPKNIPNEKWDLYSEDYTFVKPDHFPIKTYSMFFERPEEEKRLLEEKRIDPMNTLLEGLSKLLPGEQIWFQICFTPITEDMFPWQKKGKLEVEKIARRKVAIKPGELVAPELRMTPVEREIVAEIENKLKKSAFECWIRQVYLYRKDMPHNPAHLNIIREYLIPQFATDHLNRLVFYGGTRCRIHYWFKGRRLYLRKRQRFREYLERIPSYFPWNFKGEPPPFLKFLHFFGYRFLPGIRATLILNIEELATIFHFPTKIILPTVPRVEVKKVGPPPLA